MARFLDIASHQDVTDAAAVTQAGVDGVWVKLTGELGYENPKRVQQIDSLRRAGTGVGGYHFGDPRVSPADQARHFGVDALVRGVLTEGSLFPMFDAENAPPSLKWQSPAQLNDYIRVWRDVLRAEFGVVDFLVYGSESWWTSGWIDPDVWGDEHAWNWVASYNGHPGTLSGWAHSQDALHQWRSDAVPFPGISANGLDDNVTLRGHTRESLTIGENVPNISQTDLNKLLDAAEKLTHEFRVSDGGPGDVRPDDYPATRPDDVVGHTLTLRAWQDRHIGLNRSMNDGIARIETVVNQLVTAISQLQVSGQTQEGFDALFRTSTLTPGLLREGAVFVDNDNPNPPTGG